MNVGAEKVNVTIPLLFQEDEMGLPFLPRTIIIFLGLGGKTAAQNLISNLSGFQVHTFLSAAVPDAYQAGCMADHSASGR